MNKVISSAIKANEKIAEGVTSGYKKIENGVVGGYKKIEDKFDEKYLTHEGETVEEAKKRLTEEQAARAGEKACGSTSEH